MEGVTSHNAECIVDCLAVTLLEELSSEYPLGHAGSLQTCTGVTYFDLKHI